MKFMIIRRADAETEAGTMPEAELADAMMAFHDEMSKAGILRGGDGLKPTAMFAKRLKFHSGKPVVTDGPFAETKELIAGYTMIECASREEALEWVKKWPPLDGHGEVELELREVYTIDDFGDAFQGEARETHDRLKAAQELG